MSGLCKRVCVLHIMSINIQINQQPQRLFNEISILPGFVPTAGFPGLQTFIINIIATKVQCGVNFDHEYFNSLPIEATYHTLSEQTGHSSIHVVH